MRKKLAADQGERMTFTAMFVRLGKRTNYKGYTEETVLLKNIKKLGTPEVLTDHVWLTFTRAFQQLHLKEGELISFDARIKRYAKGYVNKALKINQQSHDYRLSHPTKVKKFNANRDSASESTAE
ncbi:MAG TPA: hypothetical protein VD927_13275 [Chryseosolibacter sp.]|nr:hypothetical protein [Chryseosolibacter sp.]